MGKLRYTKEHLEQIVLTQLDNLEAMNDLIASMKKQTELVTKINKKLEDELNGVKDLVQYSTTRRRKRKD